MAVNKNGIVVMGAVFVDIKGFPNDVYIPDGRNAGQVEYIHGGVSRNVVEAIAKLETDGTVILNSGGADLGTGLDTISAKIVAEVLKLPMDRITVVSGDTDSCAFDTGAYASSGTFFSGNAALVATKKLKDLIIKEAALQMEEKEEDLDVRAPGEVYSKATGAVLSYYELVHTATSS